MIHLEEAGLDTETAHQSVQKLRREAPKQLQCVWNNLNLHPKHRFEKMADPVSEINWMASLWMKERIDVNYLNDDVKKPSKKIAELSVADFLPTSKAWFHIC